MKEKQLNRLNDLFEKVLASKANHFEKSELSHLYQEYIDDGRDQQANNKSYIKPMDIR